jgi:hypothetical protein
MGDPRSFWSVLWNQPPGPHSRLTRYVVANGFLYVAIGAGIHLLPATVLLRVFFLSPLSPLEEGLLRACGMVLVPLWFMGLGPPGLVFPFAILDPVLALGAYAIWRRQEARPSPP